MIFHASPSLLPHRTRVATAAIALILVSLVLSVLALTPSADASSDADDPITIVGGEPADIEDFPFMVSLYHTDGPFEFYACTGTVVQADWVLTAAHCVEPPAEQLLLYSGISNQQQRDASEALSVVEKIVHPAYRLEEEGLFFDHDVALLRLTEPLADAQPVTLWTDQVGPVEGAEALAVGWGASEQRPAGEVLQQVEVPVLAGPDDPRCSRYPRWVFHSGSMVCAADLLLRASACFGDSGGPLAVRDEETGEVKQVGIASFGAECGSDTYGVAYMRVSTYVPWINLTIGNAEGCTIVGTEGDDELIGTRGDDVICGLGGDDVLQGRGGNDILLGHDGDDILLGGRGTDKLFGASGDDQLIGGPGHDFLEGSSGRDFLNGGGGADTLLGGYAGDRLRGGGGADFLGGGTGNDRLFGGNGRDLLFGGFDEDTSRGGPGRDVCQESETARSCREVN